MSGIKIYNTNLKGIQLSKGISVEEFKSWIVGTLGGSNYDYYYSVCRTPDGGYVAVGYQNSDSEGRFDALIVKYDNNLNLVKQAGLGGSGIDYYRSVCQTNDGGCVAVGYQKSQGEGIHDALIVKYNSDLTIDKQSGLGGSNYDYYYSVCPTFDGGYVAVGFQKSQGEGSYDALIVKYDSNLNLVTQSGLGGSSTDQYYSVCQTSDGGYVAVGYQNSHGEGSYDALIVKYNSDLTIDKQSGLGGSGSDSCQSVCQTNDGGYVAVGYQASDSEGSDDALIVKYDSNLNLVTQSGLGGSGIDYYRSVCQTSDGGYVAVGFQASQDEGSYDALIVKYNSDLTIDKQAGLGGLSDDRYQSVCPTSDGGYVAVGHQASQGEGKRDALITKLPNDFELLTGTINNHMGLSWTTPTLTDYPLSFTDTQPDLIVTTPTFKPYTPTLTEVDYLSLVETRSEKE